MRKIFVFIFLINICSFTVKAQINPDAQSILDKASDKVQSAKGINVSFSLTQKDKFGHELSTSKGILKIKGSKYYIKQESNEIFCDGAQIWNYDGSEVTVAKTDNDDDELSPQQILTGFDKKDFDINLISSSLNYQVQLIPVDKRKNFSRVILYFNKSTNLISKAVITDKTNAVTEISFSNISLNNSIADSQFTFDPSKHPGIEVVNQ